MQNTTIGEGDHEAGRRYQKRTTEFTKSTDVETIARGAAAELDDEAGRRITPTSGFELRLTLSEDDLFAIVKQATPMRIHLSGPDGPERWVELEKPRGLTLVPDVGARVTASGKFHFSAGVPIQDYINEIRVTLRPEIDTDETGSPSLALHLDLDEADLATIPGLLDRGVTKLVDRALEAKATRLMIPFGDLLATRGALSPRIQPLSEARLSVARGSMTVTDDKMIFAVDLDLELTTHGRMGEHPSA